MDRHIYGLLLLMTVFLLCGFSWGFSKGDPCEDSGKAVEGIIPGIAPAERARIEKRVLALCPDGGAERYLKGLAFEEGLKTEQAIDEYRAAIEKDPRLADAHGRLGVLLSAKGVRDEASMALFHALQLKSSPLYAKTLAGVYLDGKFFSLALYYFEQALPAFANDVSVQNGMGRCYLGQGNAAKARERFEAALRLDSGNETAHLGLADIFRQGNQYDKAVAELHLALDADAADRNNQYRLAQLLEKKRDYQAATDAYLRAVALDDDNTEAHRGAALLYLKRKMPAEAEKHFREALRLIPTDIEARNNLIAMYVKGKRYDEAMALLEEDAALHPESAESHYRLGIMYAFRRNDERAIEEFRKTISLKPDHARALNALGKAYLRTGNEDKAREAFSAARKAAPALPESTELSTGFTTNQVKIKTTHRKKRAQKNVTIRKFKKAGTKRSKGK